MTPIQYFHIAFECWAVIFGIIAAICVYATRSFEREAAVTLTWMLGVDAVMNIADAIQRMAGEYNGGMSIRLLVLIGYLCAFLFMLFTARHVACVVTIREGQEDPRLTMCSMVTAGIGMVVVIFLYGFGFLQPDERTGMIRMEFSLVLIILAELSLLPILIQCIYNRRKLRKSEYAVLFFNCILMAAAFPAQLFFEPLPCIHAAYAIMLITLVLTYQVGFSSDNIKRWKMLGRMQSQLYTRQIQPHFIYNSLSAIRSSLPEDSEARESLNHFAGFMRGSVDLLIAEGCIPASREFATVYDYLYMEQLRFGDALRVVTELQDEDFELPPFTVQTLVENAIRYGIRENEEGKGTLTIKSYQTTGNHVIEVMDDGPGFDVGRLENDRRDEHVHIGLRNIRKRLEVMCNGTLLIDSAPEKGTLARVEIPVK